MFKHLVAIVALAMPLSAAEPTPVEELLRQGLYQEEANRDFEKAAENYRAVIAQHDRQRSLAATATYRLGEIARKKGDQAAAAEAFLTVVTRFSEQEDLVRLSRENLTALGTAVPAPPVAPGTPPAAADVPAAEIARLQQLARSSPDLLDGADNEGWRPLHHAAAKGQVKVIAYLLENHADPNGRTSKEQLTPLQLASAHGHLEAVKTLLAAKAEINATVEFGVARASLPTLDNRASSAGNRPTATFSQGPDTTASALDLAIMFDRREVAGALLAGGADLKEPRLQFGLDFATTSGNQRLGRQPLPPGILGQQSNAIQIRPVIYGNDYQLSPLLAAICLQRDAVVADLLKAGAPLTLTGPEAAPDALMLAAAFNPALVPVLLKAGADPKAAMPETGATALHVAAEAGFTEAARQLLDAGADPKALDAADRTPLHLANGAALVELFVAKGADPNAKDTAGLTPLDYTAERGRESGPATLAALFKCGATSENPLALLDRAMPPGAAILRELVLRGLVYPKEARADAVLLAIHRSATGFNKSQTAVGLMEVRPAEGSTPPAVANGLWRYCRAEQGNQTTVKALTILRRDAEGHLTPAFTWSPKPGEGKAPAWPSLAWGDVVELILHPGGQDGTDFPFDQLVPSLAELTVTVRFEGMEFQRRLTSPGEFWLGSEEGKQRTAEWSPWRRGEGDGGGRGIRQRVMRPGFPRADFPIERIALVPPFADVTRIAVIRKGVAQPIAVDLTNKEAGPLRLVEGDVIELVRLDNAGKRFELEADEVVLLLSSDFTFGGPVFPADRRGWFGEFSRSSSASEFAKLADWSKLRIRRGGAGGKVEAVDLVKILAELPPSDQWSRETLAKTGLALAHGDLMVVPPLPKDANEAAREQAAATFRKMTEISSYLLNPPP